MGIRSQGQPTESYNDVWANTGKGAVTAAPGPATSASGGIISEYETPTAVYKSHIFLSDGTFAFTEIHPTTPNYADFLVVGGGGGGGGGHPGAGAAGGAGAGGLQSNWPGLGPGLKYPATHFPIAAGVNYTVTVGAGGQYGAPTQNGLNGANSVLAHPTAPITSYGGGSGSASGEGGDGGSGGGAGYPGAFGTGDTPSTPVPQG